MGWFKLSGLRPCTRQILVKLGVLPRARAHYHSHFPGENNPKSGPNRECVILKRDFEISHDSSENMCKV